MLRPFLPRFRVARTLVLVVGLRRAFEIALRKSAVVESAANGAPLGRHALLWRIGGALVRCASDADELSAGPAVPLRIAGRE